MAEGEVNIVGHRRSTNPVAAHAGQVDARGMRPSLGVFICPAMPFDIASFMPIEQHPPLPTSADHTGQDDATASRTVPVVAM